MSGSKKGGQAAAITNKSRHGDDFYARIGALGGKKGTTGGWWHTKYVKNDVESIRQAGARGGTKSKRRKQGLNGI